MEPTDESVWCQRQNPDIRDGLSLIETCAGIGIMGHGFHNCGMVTSCYNDYNYNPQFCKWLRTKTKIPVVQGNVTCPKTIYAVHGAAPTSQAITGGGSMSTLFSCGGLT